jgi:hypothetical protein
LPQGNLINNYILIVIKQNVFLFNLQGTEPPESEHARPKSDGPSPPPSSEGADPDDPAKHEEGEVKVGQVNLETCNEQPI